nr:MAG TPA: hypothetical protein [Caudoviricetes sp.]
MKKNIRVNISISPSVLEDAKRIANDRFSGNVSAYISALIDNDIKQRGLPPHKNENGDGIQIVGNTPKAKIKNKIKK